MNFHNVQAYINFNVNFRFDCASFFIQFICRLTYILQCVNNKYTKCNGGQWQNKKCSDTYKYYC